MKLALGIILTLFGGLALLIGVIVVITTLTSDYASSACERAARDREAFSEAKLRCGPPTTDCYKQATIGLTSEEDCESRQASEQKQLIMGIVPAVIGAFVGFLGLVLTIWGFIGLRKKKAVA